MKYKELLKIIVNNLERQNMKPKTLSMASIIQAYNALYGLAPEARLDPRTFPITNLKILIERNWTHFK